MTEEIPDWATGLEIANADGALTPAASLRALGAPDRVAARVEGIAPEVLVFWTDDGPRAIANECVHRGMPLEDAEVLSEHGETHAAQTTCIKCPFHGLVVSLESGLSCSTGRGVPIPTFAVRTPAAQSPGEDDA